MSQVLMRLGPHQFSVEGLSFHQFQAKYAARWKEHYTAGGGHIDQFLGASPREVTIDGVLFPLANSDRKPAQAIGQSIEQGKAMRLISSTGENFGFFKALSLSLTDEEHAPGGAVTYGRYSLTLSRFSGRNNPNPFMNQTSFVSTITARLGGFLF
jgi:phage protein U